MAMGRDGHSIDSAYPLSDIANQVAELQGNCVANGVGNVQSCCAGLNDSFEHLKKKLRLSAGRVFRRKLNVLAKRARQANRLGGLFKALLAGDAQLVL